MSKSDQYSSSHRIDRLFHIPIYSLCSFEGLFRFPRQVWTFLTYAYTTFPGLCSGGALLSSSPSNWAFIFQNGCLRGRKRRWSMYTILRDLLRYMESIPSKQCGHPACSLLLYPERLRIAGESVTVTNSRARSIKYSRLYSSQTSTPSDHRIFRSSIKGLRYVSMSFPG